jgi:hypothetical protein
MEHGTLIKLLGNEAFKSETKTRFSVETGYAVAVLLATQTTSTISKVLHVVVDSGGCTLTTEESTYLLPLTSIFAIRIDADKSASPGRTGFLA